jgi:hypothetical protein
LEPDPTRISRRRFLGFGITVGVILLASGTTYQQFWRAPETLAAGDRAILEAIALTLYPGNPGPPGDRAGVGDFVLRYMRDAMDPGAARSLRALLRAVEWGCAIATGRRFTRQDAGGRQAFLAALEAHPWDGMRFAVMALKMVVSLGYFEHPEVLKVAGISRLCETTA